MQFSTTHDDHGISTSDGYTLRAFSSMYMDYGLEIIKDGETVYYNPHCLSSENYGRKPAPRFDGEWEDAEEAEHNGTDDAFVAWTVADWDETLEAEADELIDAFVAHPDS